MKFIFIADWFAEHILGGGELNNEEVISVLKKKHQVEKIQSQHVSNHYIRNNKDKKFIVSNFINLNKHCKNEIMKLDYVIYEHDHKYLINRNPAEYKNFIAPKDQIINYDFYKNAKAVLCQSQFHCDIVKSNLGLSNIINLSGNLWSLDSLNVMKILSQKPKRDSYAVMNSATPHKNTREAKQYCEVKNKPYELISSNNYYEFLSLLGSNNGFVFMPKTPETLSRVIVEARMMGLSVITNKRVGATKEPWYSLKGLELIKEVENMRIRIPNTIMEIFK